MAIKLEDVVTINSSSDLKIYDKENSFRIFAGPGAGKTHLLIENIKHLVQNSNKLKKDGRQILCITYTNAAANEIKKRLGNFNKYVYVSTIHSFLYDIVIRQNMKQLIFQIKKQFNIELNANSKLTPRVEGMNLLAMTKKEDLYAWLKDKIDESKISSLSKTKMANFVFDIKNINSYPFNEENIVKVKKVNDYSELESKIVKTAILEVAKELDFDEILYLGYVLINEYKHIKYLLKYKFPYVLVDEYQDTNPIQNQIIKLFANNKDVVLGVIGDLIQSIYSFQGATYQEFENFSSENNQIDYRIEGNRRSTKNIVEFCSYFRQGDPIIPLQSSNRNTDINKKVKIILHTSDVQPNEAVTTDDDTVILCRSAAEAFSFINIDITQKTALKRIADTYQYSLGRDMLNTIQQGREEWIAMAEFVVNIKEASELKSLGKALLVCEKLLDTNKIKKASINQKENYKQFLKFINNFNDINNDMNIIEIKNKVNLWLKECGLLRDPNFLFYIPEIKTDEQYFEGIHNYVNQLMFSTLKEMIKSIYIDNSKIMTIHKAKGLEFKKVIVGIEPFSRNENFINKLEILKSPKVLPSQINNGGFESEVAEYARIIYVGISRAIDELTLYIKINKNAKNLFQNEFENSLRTFMKENNITEEFYEFIEK